MELGQVNGKATDLAAQSPLEELTRRDALINLPGSAQ